MGKRVKWFEENEIVLINEGEDIGIASLFKDHNSAAGLPTGATFQKPNGFEDELERVATYLNLD